MNSAERAQVPSPESMAPESMAEVEWRSWLTAIAGSLLLYESITGLAVYLLPFSTFTQFSVLLHTVIGVLSMIPLSWYLVRHWWVRRKGNLSHFQLLGYIALALLVISTISGLVVTWQGLVGPRMEYVWDIVHLTSSIALMVLIVVHLVTVIVKKINNPDAAGRYRAARRAFYLRSSVACLALLAIGGVWALRYDESTAMVSFPDQYNWKFGEDRPFAPSLARVDDSDWTERTLSELVEVLGQDQRRELAAALGVQASNPVGFFASVRSYMDEKEIAPDRRQRVETVLTNAAKTVKQHGAIAANVLAGSDSCGTSGCHTQIYEEWLPSAHRYSSMDDMFQRVQVFMAKETSPEHTRYCAGCHDPISLFSGAKNSGNITLSATGADEGISCLVCHSIVQTDVQGNGDYTIAPPRRYAYETHEGKLAKLVSDFLIRTYPTQHISSYSRALYKTPEFCGACHKQYLDKEVNTDIGKVQGQNQYDSWKNSRWHRPDDPRKNIGCRECHMPLIDSDDPARGDATDYNRTLADDKHRSHRTLAGNQYIPAIHKLEGHEEHIALTEAWLQGKIDIPEIADKWATGPVVTMELIAPETVTAGEELSVQVILSNNKTGHDFPTGPLDMIESWIELKVTDDVGKVLYHSGTLGADGRVKDPQIWYKADEFDRRGGTIDRHNLWDMVGASYKRSLYPGVTDSATIQLQCPSMARGRVAPDENQPAGQRHEEYTLPAMPKSAGRQLTVTGILWYRKANPEFLDRVYGADAAIRSPVTLLTKATTQIKVAP